MLGPSGESDPMRNWSLFAVVAWLAVLAPIGAEEPRESGLVERTGRRLVQLDVTVSGPREQIASLEADDFQLSITGKKIKQFTLDNLCQLADEPPSREEETEPAVATPALPDTSPAPQRARATFLFYFDQNHLTLGGRQQALETARELARELVVGGNRAMVVSAGREVRTYAEMTDDADEVLRAIDTIETDRSQWDPQTTVFSSEENRIEQVIDYLNDGDLDQALTLARQFQRDETWRSGKALRLFSLTIGRLSDVEPPKAVVYFADTMRSNAGEHYLSFFGTANRRGQDENIFKKMEMDSFTAGASFQRVIEEASSHGVRLYTIQAEGLVMTSPRLTVTNSARSGSATAGYNNQRVRDAQNSLVSLARETGGDSFLNGVRAEKIAEKIYADMECVYLLSFDPGDLAEDRDLPVSLRTSRKKVKLQVKGVLVIQSEEKRRASRLLAAFAAPEAVESDSKILGTVVPTGYHDGEFSALVQLAVPGSPLAGTVWDMGLSLVARGKVREDAAGRVSVSGAAVPVIFETEMDFAPGPYELIAVAHETSADSISTGRVEASWPDPDDGPATIGPVAVLQPSDGAFLRDTEFRTRGSRAILPKQPARTDRPTAMIGIVCRGTGKRRLRIERTLEGDSAAEFKPQELDLSDERCALFADRIAAGTMTSGAFRYEVRVIDVEDEEELVSTVRSFLVATAEEISGVVPSPGAS
jgi:VWFA-related protein